MNIPSVNLPADLPTNWTNGQIVSPSGTDVGLSQQHGYNYLNGAVNDAQAAIKAIRDFFAGSAMVGTSDLMNSAVTTAKLADKAVSTGKLGDKAVTTEKLADKAVTWSKLSDESRPIHQNILYNWYFPDPINQRGKTEYAETTSITYNIDRWKASNMKVTVQSDGVKIESGPSDYKRFIQVLDSQMKGGQQYTLSILADIQSVGGSVSLRPGNNLGMFAGSGVGLSGATPGLKLYTYTFTPTVDSTNGMVEILCLNRTSDHITATIKAAKLELGGQQTLAHQDASGNWALNDPPPNKALELAKCQAYDYELGYDRLIGTMLCYGYGSTASFFLPLPVTMRATPVVITSGIFLLETTEGLFSASINPQNGGVYNGGNGIYFAGTLDFVSSIPDGRFVGIVSSIGNGKISVSSDL